MKNQATAADPLGPAPSPRPPRPAHHQRHRRHPPGPARGDGDDRARPPAVVEPLLLRDVYGMSYDEIAQQVGAPLGTVKAQIHHGRSSPGRCCAATRDAPRARSRPPWRTAARRRGPGSRPTARGGSREDAAQRRGARRRRPSRGGGERRACRSTSRPRPRRGAQRAGGGLGLPRRRRPRASTRCTTASTSTGTPTPDTLTGRQTLLPRPPRPTTPSSSTSASPRVTGAQLDGEPVDHRHDRARTSSCSTGRADERYELVLDYAGTPSPVEAPTTRSDIPGHGFTIDAEHQAWTMQEPFGAYSWYAVNDQPSDKAFYDFTLSVPSPFTGIANGGCRPPRPTAARRPPRRTSSTTRPPPTW